MFPWRVSSFSLLGGSPPPSGDHYMSSLSIARRWGEPAQGGRERRLGRDPGTFLFLSLSLDRRSVNRRLTKREKGRESPGSIRPTARRLSPPLPHPRFPVQRLAGRLRNRRGIESGEREREREHLEGVPPPWRVHSPSWSLHRPNQRLASWGNPGL